VDVVLHPARIFGEARIFAVLCNTHHLYARSIRHLVITAHGFCLEPKSLRTNPDSPRLPAERLCRPAR
jgi:hypothetical protein